MARTWDCQPVLAISENLRVGENIFKITENERIPLLRFHFGLGEDLICPPNHSRRLSQSTVQQFYCG